MRTARIRWAVAALACGLFTVGLSLHTATAKKKKDVCKPGADKNFSWKKIGINEARRKGKPILLYIYDPMGGKASDPVKKVQKEVFANSGVKEAFARFLMVMQPHSASNWPPAYTRQAKNGVALYVMTCNARPLATFTHRNLPKATTGRDGKDHYMLLEAAAAAALKMNPKVAAAMKKNPPKDYLSPEERAAKRAAAAEPEPVRKEEKKGAASLLDGPLGGDKKGDGKKKPEKKKPAPPPEDEEE